MGGVGWREREGGGHPERERGPIRGGAGAGPGGLGRAVGGGSFELELCAGSARWMIRYGIGTPH